MDIVFYGGERFFIEAAPKNWDHSAWVRITDKPLRPDPAEWPDTRQSFSVPADALRTAPPVANVLTAQRLPTVASVERKEKAKSGQRDVGDEIAAMLRPAQTLEDVYKIASDYLGVPVIELKDRYSKLNPGQQRMNLGNKMRFKWRKGG